MQGVGTLRAAAGAAAARWIAVLAVGPTPKHPAAAHFQVRNDALRAEELRRRVAASEEGAGIAGLSGTAAAFHEGQEAEPQQGMEYTAALPEAAAAALGTCVGRGWGGRQEAGRQGGREASTLQAPRRPAGRLSFVWCRQFPLAHQHARPCAARLPLSLLQGPRPAAHGSRRRRRQPGRGGAGPGRGRVAGDGAGLRLAARHAPPQSPGAGLRLCSCVLAPAYFLRFSLAL